MRKIKRSSGIGFFVALAVVLSALKLAGVGAIANLSWAWVLAPLWAPIVLIFCVTIIGMVFFLSGETIDKGPRI